MSCSLGWLFVKELVSIETWKFSLTECTYTLNIYWWSFTNYCSVVSAAVDPVVDSSRVRMSKNKKAVLCGMIQYSIRPKRLAIRAQAVCFMHSTMPSVTCLRLSDVSVICRVTCFQFPIQSAFLQYIGRQSPGSSTITAYYWF